MVYLLFGYNLEGVCYLVMYLLYGNVGNVNDWVMQGWLQVIVDMLIECYDILFVVIVMLQGGIDWYVDCKEKMQSVFFNDLLLEVEVYFVVLNQCVGCVIGGVLMGGFGVLCFLLFELGLFCGVMLLSFVIYVNELLFNFVVCYVGVFGDWQFDLCVWYELNYLVLLCGYFVCSWCVLMFIVVGDDDLMIQVELSVLYMYLCCVQNLVELCIVDGGYMWDVWCGLFGQGLRYVLECVK